MSWDSELFRLLNQTLTHPWLDRVMPGLTSSATYRWPLLGLALCVLVLGTPRQRWILLGLGLCVGVADQLSSGLLKPLVDRPRPSFVLPGVRLLIGAKHSGSFPSSHAVNLAAATWYLQRTVARPWLSTGMLLVLGVISYSRIYVGVHYPADVLGGALIGGLLAELLLRLTPLRRLRSASEADVAKGQDPRPRS